MFHVAIPYILLRVWLVATIGLTAAVVVAHTALPPTEDPLAPYASIFPSNTRHGLSNYMPSLTYGFTFSEWQYYTFTPSDGVVRSISVNIREGRIIGTYFSVNNILLGDLVGLWGLPTHIYGGTYYREFVWDCGVRARARYQDTNPMTRRSLFTLIEFISMGSRFVCGDYVSDKG
jgi:hypothetical protein